MKEITKQQMEDRFRKRFARRFDFGVGKGWYPLLADLDDELSAIDADYTVTQIKEKFGGLRFYAAMSSGASEMRADIIGVGSFSKPNEQAAGDPAYGQFRAAIAAAEDASYRICEDCGEPGGMCATSTGWWVTLCPACAAATGAGPVRDVDGDYGEGD